MAGLSPWSSVPRTNLPVDRVVSARRGDRSPTDQLWPKGSWKPPWRWVPQGTTCSSIGDPRVAPADSARARSSSGSSTNSSIRARSSSLDWTGLARVVRIDLVEEERSAVDLKPRHSSEIPELMSSERPLVPVERVGRVRHDEHDRDRRSGSGRSVGLACTGVIRTLPVWLPPPPAGGQRPENRARGPAPLGAMAVRAKRILRSRSKVGTRVLSSTRGMRTWDH